MFERVRSISQEKLNAHHSQIEGILDISVGSQSK